MTSLTSVAALSSAVIMGLATATSYGAERTGSATALVQDQGTGATRTDTPGNSGVADANALPSNASGATASDNPGTPQTAPAAPTPSDSLPATSESSQEQPAADSSSQAADATGANHIETVVVTARRTKENLQNVPTAVTAFSSADLERQQINSPTDLNGIVPSLNINTGGSTRSADMPTIRGQGGVISSSPGVVMYYSEVPLPADIFFTSQGGPGKFFDLANLQVLKGSQGTLFGRNTTGGAILLEPHKPDSSYSAYLKGETGDYSARGVEGVLNIPMTDEDLSVRLGAKYYQRNGYTKDIVSGEDLDSEGYRTLRLGVLWKPADNIENYLLGYDTYSSNNGTSEVLEQINNTAYTSFFGVTLPPGVSIKPGCLAVALSLGKDFASNYQTCGSNIIAAQQARGVRNVALSTPPNDIISTGGVIDHFTYTINDYLALHNIASWQALRHHYRWDQDGSILNLDSFYAPDDVNVSNQEQYTEELQLQGHARGHALTYVAGLYSQYTKPAGPEENLAAQFGIVNTKVYYSIDARTIGPYAQATYNLGDLSDPLDGLSLTLGGRYSSDETSGTTNTGEYLPNGETALTGGTPVYSDVKSSAPTFTAGVDYKLGDTLLYGKVSRGYKSGGISPQAVSPTRLTYKPEYVINYEIGNKSDFLIGDTVPIRLNNALYYTIYSDVQKTATDNYGTEFGAATVNAAGAQIEGAEVELTAQPLDRLTLLLNYSYTYGKYKQFSMVLQTITPQLDCTGRENTNGATVQLSCIPFAFIPRHQGSLTARYRLPVPESLGKVNGTLTYSFTDRMYSSFLTLPQAEPGAWLGAYGLLNGSMDWTNIAGKPVDLELFCNNMTDRTYRVSNSNIWSFLYFQSSIYGAPRMFGLQLSYHWGE